MSDPQEKMFDLGAEQAVLGAIMYKNEILEQLTLSVESFYREAHREIYRAMNALSLDGVEIDMVTLGNWLRESGKINVIGGSSYLVELLNHYPVGSRPDYYAGIVERSAGKRHAYAKAAESIESTRRYMNDLMSAHDDNSIQLISDRWESQFLAYAASAVEPFRKDSLSHRGHAWLAPALNELHETYRLAENNPDSVRSTISSTFEGLDEILELPGDNLTVVGARPGMGKSSLAVNWMRAYAEMGEVPYLFVLEDATREQLFRLLAQLTRVPAPTVRRLIERRADHPDAARDLQIIFEMMNSLPAGMNMGFDDTPYVTIETIRMKAKQRHREGATMFFIDHALKVKPSENKGDRRLEVSHVVRQSAALAMELGCPVVLFTQLKRLEKDRRPTYSDLKETGNFEEDARAIILLYREEFALAQKRKEKKITYPHPVELIVPKANHFAVGTAYAIFEPTRTLMREPTTEEMLWINRSRTDSIPYNDIATRMRSHRNGYGN